MDTPNGSDRRTTSSRGPTLVGLPVRDADIEPTRGLHWVAILFRVLSGLLVLLMIVQIVNGITSVVPLSAGVLIAESVRLLIFAGLLWGAGDLADLFVKSHYDLRATRILLERLAHPGGSGKAEDVEQWKSGRAS